MLEQVLKAEGHRVAVADGGQNGLEIFRAAQRRGEPFEIVITDLGMRYVDGRQVAKMIKIEAPATRLIMLTGWGVMMKDDGDFPNQVDGILSKPPKIQELNEMLAKLLARKATETSPGLAA
jgi:DNA-binding response OmpR family regulator